MILTAGIRFALGSNVLGADLYTNWIAAKALFIQQLSPYSDQVVEATQFGHYNRLTFPGEDQVAFAYPVLILFIVFPFAYLDFPLAQAIWMALHTLLLISLAFLLYTQYKFRPVLTIPLFYPFSFAIIVGNVTLTFGMFIFIFLWAHFSQKTPDHLPAVLLGIGLAFAAGKPQFSLPVLGILLLICLKYRYWHMLAGFAGGLALLLAGSFLLLPSWFSEWLSRVEGYSQYITMTPLMKSLIDVIERGRINDVITPILFLAAVTLLIFSIITWWRGLRGLRGTEQNSHPVNKGTLKELFILALAGFITVTFHPSRFSYDQIIMFLPFFLWAVGSYSENPKIVHLFWWTGLALGWIAFFVSLFGLYAQAQFTLPVLFIFIWLAYLWSTTRATRKENAHAPA